ncbi:MAG: biotin--[acetyl-CoA-carboxylase] ligase [Thermodesulfobacteriota bacterium]
MGIANFLLPDQVDDLVRAEEMSLRAACFPPEDVAAVFRYGAPVGSRIHCHRHLVRGMDEARRLIDACERRGGSFSSGTVIVADTLSGGKGRFRRDWHAPAGGVWLTAIIANTLLPESARLYPFAAGVACCETVRSLGAPASLKWVNDVLADGRKLAGVLIEQYRSPVHGEEFFLLGIGINVNNTGFPPAVAGISLLQTTGRSHHLPAVTCRLLAKLRWNIGLLHREEARWLSARDGADSPPPHPLMAAWRNLSDTVGRQVEFGFDVQLRPEYRATVVGVADDGGLVLRHGEPPTVCTEIAGEILYL